MPFVNGEIRLGEAHGAVFGYLSPWPSPGRPVLSDSARRRETNAAHMLPVDFMNQSSSLTWGMMARFWRSQGTNG